MQIRLKSSQFVLLLMLALLLLVSACASSKLQKLEDTFVCDSIPEQTILIGFTTEQQTILPSRADVYRELEDCKGWSRYLRDDLVGRAKEEAKPEALLTMVHLSDVHILDAESPLRVEYLRHRRGLRLPHDEFQAGFRPQETMTTQVAESMIRQLNAIGVGPVTKRPFDLAVSTGDTGDNHQMNELKWFITLLNGGYIDPNSGGSGYEGVQDNTPSPLYCQFWHPDPVIGEPCASEQDTACWNGCTDKFKHHGFPELPGLLAEAISPFTATGLQIPWYTAYGNHDELIQGNFPIRPDLNPQKALNTIATGPSKLIELPKRLRSNEKLLQEIFVDFFLLEFLNPLNMSGDWERLLKDWTSKEVRQITPDRDRRLWSKREYIQTFLDNEGPHGPAGHGFDTTHRDSGKLYYAFDIRTEEPRIRGIVLNTTNPSGMANGSLDRDQVNWMEEEIKKVSSKYYKPDGTLDYSSNKDALVILFSHHDLATLDNHLPGPHSLLTPRVLKTEFEKILHRYPNVILWLNGHTHFSRVFPHPGKTETSGFWEINTPSLIDFPQMTRIVELVDNQNGILSVFATLVDHAAPAKYTNTNDPILRLASISRELAVNDMLLKMARQLGPRNQRNVELLIRAPFEITK